MRSLTSVPATGCEYGCEIGLDHRVLMTQAESNSWSSFPGRGFLNASPFRTFDHACVKDFLLVPGISWLGNAVMRRGAARICRGTPRVPCCSSGLTTLKSLFVCVDSEGLYRFTESTDRRVRQGSRLLCEAEPRETGSQLGGEVIHRRHDEGSIIGMLKLS